MPKLLAAAELNRQVAQAIGRIGVEKLFDETRSQPA